MSLDFRNINTLWTSVLAETLSRLGVKVAVVCPGSRSAPLAVAFAQHPQIEAIPILDERSASFFALGIARLHHAIRLLGKDGLCCLDAYRRVLLREHFHWIAYLPG